MSETKAQTGWRANKWVRAAIPALLLHCSIGTVYCWSIFSQEIADHIGFEKSSVEWAFSFAIFFLGMSAAFLGNVVEKDILLGHSLLKLNGQVLFLNLTFYTLQKCFVCPSGEYAVL